MYTNKYVSIHHLCKFMALCLILKVLTRYSLSCVIIRLFSLVINQKNLSPFDNNVKFLLSNDIS